MDDKFRKMREERARLTVEPVVETRFREKKYVPEMATLNENYILHEPFNSHDEAKAYAEAKAKELKDKIEAVIKTFVAHYPKAKE